MTLPINHSSDTPIRPRDVDSSNTFVSAFGKRETEVTAFLVVRFCQLKKNWKPFTVEAFTQYCLSAHDHGSEAKVRSYLLDGLTHLNMGEYIRIDKGVVTLTTAFVARCYQKAPVLGTPRKRSPKPKLYRANRYDRLASGEDIV